MIFELLVLLFLFTLYCGTRNFDYWKKRNVKHDRPIPFFGNSFRNIVMIRSTTEISVELYRKYPEEKVIGFFKGTTPVLIIKDLDLIKHVLNKDFVCFFVRGLGGSPVIEPLNANLLMAEGDLWRLLRQRLTGAFTTAKLRAMTPLLVRCAERLQALLATGGQWDAKDLMARFSTEFIGACGFGIEMDTINKEHSEFIELGKLVFDYSLQQRILFPIAQIFPAIKKYFRVMHNVIVEKSMLALVKNICEQRNFNPIGRNDFIDLLLELRNKGKIQTDSIERTNVDGTSVKAEMEMDLMCMAAQVFIFFAAGFETSSFSTSYTLHELAYNPHIQNKVQEDIDKVMSKHNNKLSYEAISEMTLLDMAFKEAMRIFPSGGVLTRECTRKYKLPGLDFTIDPGVKIEIPVQAIHMDEQYYDNPQEFRPERFLPQEVQNRPYNSYLPFGDGPRACIAAKLGRMQSLAGLAAILHKFSVEPAASSTRHPSVNHSANLVQSIAPGLPLNFKPRNRVGAKCNNV